MAVTTLFNAVIYQFPESDSTVEVFLEGGYQNGDQVLENFAERGTGQQVSETEFVKIIAKESGQIASSPEKSQPYPLKSPLRIDTESISYIMPVDWGHPYTLSTDMLALKTHPMYYYGFSDVTTCSDSNCTYISPDNLNIATLTSEGQVGLTYGYSIPGKDALFSTTSDAIAVWNDCDLAVYSTGYPRLQQNWYKPEYVNSITLTADKCDRFYHMATWSPDGRFLAYADASGIWLWDVFTSNISSNLLVNNDDSVAKPNFFSPLGRYLNFSEGETNSYIDIVSGEKWQDGFISPDEKLLVKSNTKSSSLGYDVCSLLTGKCGNNTPMYLATIDEQTGEVEQLFAPSLIGKTQWRDNMSFFQVACIPDKPDYCGVFIWKSDYYNVRNQLLSLGFDFAFNEDTSTLAIVQDARSLLIDGIHIDTSQWIESDIIGIAWMPSLFYYE